MPRELTSTKFDALVQRLERMADGISRHKGEADFPKRLDDAQRQAMRDELEAKRERYEVLMKQAAQAYEAYKTTMVAITKELGKDDETLRGFYGKDNRVVTEFGTKMHVPHGGRRSKPGPPPAA